MSEVKRPLVISIIAILTFLLGVSGTVLALIGLGAISQLSEIVGIYLYYLYFMLIGLVLFPLLTIAGYNMWKMKKWAANLAVAVYLFDSLTTPFISLLANRFDAGDVLGLTINILFLVGIASSWKDFH